MGSKAIKLKDVSGNLIYPCPYYPVGSIYISVNNINPSTFFGGTWERIKGQYLFCDDHDNMGGQTFGSWDSEGTVLKENQIPSHNHTGSTGTGYTNFLRMVWGTMVDRQDGNHTGSSGNGSYRDLQNTGTFPGANHTHSFTTNNTGGGQAHSHKVYPPSIRVFVWKRTA